MSNSHDERARRGSGGAPTLEERAVGVLDPSWEEALRGGQEADGEQGSVDAELALLHLLRHAREPEPLHDAALERLWAAIDESVAPQPWWRRKWLFWAAPVLAVTAVLVVIALPDEEGPVAVARHEAPAEVSAAVEKGAADSLALAEERDEGAVPVGAGALEQARAGGGELAAPGRAEMPAGEPESALQAEAKGASTTGAAAGAGASALERQFALLELDARAALVAEIDRERATLRHDLVAYAKRGGR